MRRLIVLGCVCATFVPVSHALAGTATSDGATIRVTSSPGEALNVHIGSLRQDPGVLALDSLAGTLEPGPGCTPGASSGVRCLRSGVPTVIFDLGDGDDRLHISNLVPIRVEASGGTGNDTLSGDDLLPQFAVTTVLDGGPGNDTLTPGRGPDTLIGGDGADRVDYAKSKTPTAITMNGLADDGPAGEGDNVGADFEFVHGSSTAANTIVGSDLSVPVILNAGQRLSGGSAADVIDGGGGPDLIDGGGGDDTLTGGAGDDGVLGEEGNDTIDGGPGFDSLIGDLGDDRLLARDGERDEELLCDDGNDAAQADLLLDAREVRGCEDVQEAWIGAPLLLLRSEKVSVRRGRLRLPISCVARATGRCKGRIVVRRRKTVLARARVDLKPLARRTLRAPVRRLARRRIKAVVQVRLRGAHPASSPIVIRRR